MPISVRGPEPSDPPKNEKGSWLVLGVVAVVSFIALLTYLAERAFG